MDTLSAPNYSGEQAWQARRPCHWFVENAISAYTSLFVVNGDLITCKRSIQERNLWVNLLIQMGSHAPVILVASNHGRELYGDLRVLSRAKAAPPIHLCTESGRIEIGEAGITVFPCPRKGEAAGKAHNLHEDFAEHLGEFSRRFEQRPRSYKLFFGHFGVAGLLLHSNAHSFWIDPSVMQGIWELRDSSRSTGRGGKADLPGDVQDKKAEGNLSGDQRVHQSPVGLRVVTRAGYAGWFDGRGSECRD